MDTDYVPRNYNSQHFSEDEMKDLGRRLHHDRMIVQARGHDWDVADIMAVYEQFEEDTLRDRG